MAKYQKLPVVIEAIQIGTHEDMPHWFVSALVNRKILSRINGFAIITNEGTMRAENGDYIIQGVNGELYPCKAEIFEKTYRKVEEGEIEND